MEHGLVGQGASVNHGLRRGRPESTHELIIRDITKMIKLVNKCEDDIQYAEKEFSYLSSKFDQESQRLKANNDTLRELKRAESANSYSRGSIETEINKNRQSLENERSRRMGGIKDSSVSLPHHRGKPESINDRNALSEKDWLTLHGLVQKNTRRLEAEIEKLAKSEREGSAKTSIYVEEVSEIERRLQKLRTDLSSKKREIDASKGLRTHAKAVLSRLHKERSRI